MIQFLISLLPASLFIYAVNILFQEGHLLEKPGKWMRDNWPDKITKPLFDCAICQSSFWGAVSFVAIDYLFGVHLPLKQFIPYIFCLCGLNTIINKLISKERIIIDE